MEKVLGNISFFGAILVVFIGVLMIIVKASPSMENEATAAIMGKVMMIILVVSGSSTFLYILRTGMGKGKQDN